MDTQSLSEQVSIPPETCDYLFLVLDVRAPTRGGMAFCLGDSREVSIGRSNKRSYTRKGGALHIEIDDPTLSEAHVEICRDKLTWIINDKGSKNGLFVDGHKLGSTVLSEGTVFEVGHCFFLFRRVTLFPDDLASKPKHRFSSINPALLQAAGYYAEKSRHDVPLLITGPSGSGRSRTASELHTLHQKSGAFVEVACAELPEDLAATALLGSSSDEGVFQQARNGTLFFENIEALPTKGQAVLARVLRQEEDLGCRLISASSGLLQEPLLPELCTGLSALVYALPALREHPEDLGLLAAPIFETADGHKGLTNLAMRTLLSHHWPGDRLEYQRVLRCALALSDGEAITIGHLPETIGRTELDPKAPRHRPPYDIEVGPNANWFRLYGGQTVNLSTRKAPRAILHRLVIAQQEAADEPVAASELFEAGWPGQKVHPDSARHRVHVAVSTLRRLGLKEFLARRHNGYVLDSSHRLHLDG